MKKAIKNKKGQKGQALILVLALLAVGGITIASSLNYATTILKDNNILKTEMVGIYSASAGIDYAVWSLENSEEIPANLTDNVNGMSVYIQEEDKGTFTMYCGELTYVL